MDEIWKEVPSVPGLMASSIGRVFLLEYEIQMPNGGIKKIKSEPTFGADRKANKNAAHVYKGTRYARVGNIKIHRAVCEAFYGPPKDTSFVVIHLDEDATNNKVENLKWGSQRENLNMPKVKAYHRSRTGENSPVYKGLMKV